MKRISCISGWFSFGAFDWLLCLLGWFALGCDAGHGACYVGVMRLTGFGDGMQIALQ